MIFSWIFSSTSNDGWTLDRKWYGAPLPDEVRLELGRQRGGRDDERVQRRHIAPVFGEFGGERLGGADDDGCGDRPVLRPDDALADLVDRGVLIDDPAALLDPAGETAHQLVRVQQGAVLGVDTAEHTGCVDLLARGVGIEQLPLPVGAEPLGAIDSRLRPRPLRLAAGKGDESVAGVFAVDLLGRDDVADLADRFVHRRLQIQGGAMRVQLFDAAERHREDRGRPPTVASRGAETGVFPFEQNYFQRRVGLQQIVGRPQSGEPGTDDRHVGGDVAGQRGPPGCVLSVFAPQGCTVCGT